MKSDYFVAQEDTNIYNVFSVDDFDDDGFLIGHEDDDSYHRSAFDIVAWFDSFEEACDWVEEHSN